MTTPKTFDPLNLSHFDGQTDLRDVLQDRTLTTDEKRALLASWASDARAVPDHPAFRRLDNGHVLQIDAVLDALKSLDPQSPATRDTDKWRPRKGHSSRLGQRWRKHFKDDDDDDPFSPAPAMRPPRFPALDGAAQAAA